MARRRFACGVLALAVGIGILAAGCGGAAHQLQGGGPSTAPNGSPTGGPPPNTPPTAQAQSLSTPENQQLAITLLGADPDGDHLSFALVHGPANGTLTGDIATGNTTYQPSQDYVGSDSFTFVASDGTWKSDRTKVTIQVTQQPSGGGSCDLTSLASTGELSCGTGSYTAVPGGDCQGVDVSSDGSYSVTWPPQSTSTCTFDFEVTLNSGTISGTAEVTHQ